MAIKIIESSPLAMFDVVISNIKTGKVNRRRFQSYELVGKFIDQFWAGYTSDGANGRPRDPKDYRVEITTNG